MSSCPVRYRGAADSSGSPHMKNDKRVVYVVDVARILQALAVLLAMLLN